MSISAQNCPKCVCRQQLIANCAPQWQQWRVGEAKLTLNTPPVASSSSGFGTVQCPTLSSSASGLSCCLRLISESLSNFRVLAEPAVPERLLWRAPLKESSHLTCACMQECMSEWWSICFDPTFSGGDRPSFSARANRSDRDLSMKIDFRFRCVFFLQSKATPQPPLRYQGKGKEGVKKK